MDMELIAIITIAVGGGLGIAGIGLKALSLWVHRPVGPAGDAADVQRIEELEERVAELEERVDFSERLLAERRHEDRTRLAGE